MTWATVRQTLKLCSSVRKRQIKRMFVIIVLLFLLLAVGICGGSERKVVLFSRMKLPSVRTKAVNSNNQGRAMTFPPRSVKSSPICSLTEKIEDLFIVGYAVLCLTTVGKVAFGRFTIARLLHNKTLRKPPTEIVAALTRIARRSGIEHPVEIFISSTFINKGNACAVSGFRYGAIIFHEDTLHWPKSELEAVMAHECKHILSHDMLQLAFDSALRASLLWVFQDYWAVELLNVVKPIFHSRRQREFAADAHSAMLYGPVPLIANFEPTVKMPYQFAYACLSIILLFFSGRFMIPVFVLLVFLATKLDYSFFLKQMSRAELRAHLVNCGVLPRTIKRKSMMARFSDRVFNEVTHPPMEERIEALLKKA